MARVVTPERMDEPGVAREELDASLRFLRRVNARLGGRWALIGSLERWSRGWPAGARVELLDVATGSADLPAEAVRWAASRGFDLRVTGIDSHETTLALAREHVAAQGEEIASRVTLERCDAREMVERFGDRSFDYAHAGLFLHHLEDIEVMTVLRQMERAARVGVVWNDLLRSWPARLGVRVLTAGRAEIVKHDARVSVEAGFTRREAREIAARVGLEGVRVRTNVLAQRFALTAERGDARLGCVERGA